MKYLNHFLPPEMKQFLSNRRRDTHMNWYESASDWEQELERCGATGWRVSSVNDRFEMSTRYNGIVASTSLFLCYISVFPNILSNILYCCDDSTIVCPVNKTKHSFRFLSACRGSSWFHIRF